MAQKTVAALKAKRQTTIYPNGLNEINGTDHAIFEDDKLDSHFNMIDHYHLLNLREYSASRSYRPGECCVDDFIIWQNISLGNLINLEPSAAPDPSPWFPLTFLDNGFSEFAPYDNATSYIVNNTVRYGNKLYRCILATIGNAPPNLTYWEEVSPALGGAIPNWIAGSFYKHAKLVRFENNIYRCNVGGGLFSGFGSDTFLSEFAEGKWTVFPEPVDITRANLVARMAAGQVAFNQWYFLTDENIWLKGTSLFTVSVEGLMKTHIPNAGSDPDFQGVWEPNPTAYSVDDIVFWLNKLYVNLTGTNTVTNPRSDTTNWQLIPTADDTKYRYEIDHIEYDIANARLLVWKDKRGNVLRRNELDNDWFDKFKRGDDQVRNCQTFNNSVFYCAHVSGFSVIMGYIFNFSSLELKGVTAGEEFSNSTFINAVVVYDRPTTGIGIRSCAVNTSHNLILLDEDNAGFTPQNLAIEVKPLTKITVDVSGLTTIDLAALKADFFDIIILTSTNPSETIDTISNGIADKKYLFEASSTGITFQHGTVNIKCKGAADIVLANGDNCELLWRTSSVNELNRSNY